MSRMLDNIPSTLVRMLALAAIVAILVPTWSMAMCSMDMDLGTMLFCDSVWLASDAETGTAVSVFVFALLLIAAAPIVARAMQQTTVQPLRVEAHDPHPRRDGPKRAPAHGERAERASL